MYYRYSKEIFYSPENDFEQITSISTEGFGPPKLREPKNVPYPILFGTRIAFDPLNFRHR